MNFPSHFTDYFFQSIGLCLPTDFPGESMKEFLHTNKHILSKALEYTVSTLTFDFLNYDAVEHPNQEQKYMSYALSLDNQKLLRWTAKQVSDGFFSGAENRFIGSNLRKTDFLLWLLKQRHPNDSLFILRNKILEEYQKIKPIIKQRKDGRYYFNMHEYMKLVARYAIYHGADEIEHVKKVVLENIMAAMSSHDTLYIEMHSCATNYYMNSFSALLTQLKDYGDQNKIHMIYAKPHQLTDHLLLWHDYNDNIEDVSKQLERFQAKNQHMGFTLEYVAMEISVYIKQKDYAHYINELEYALKLIPQHPALLYRLLCCCMNLSTEDKVLHLSSIEDVFFNGRSGHTYEILNALHVHFLPECTVNEFLVQVMSMYTAGMNGKSYQQWCHYSESVVLDEITLYPEL